MGFDKCMKESRCENCNRYIYCFKKEVGGERGKIKMGSSKRKVNTR
jgi:hypothetical protein